MTTVAIIQARMRSTRLPGKVLADLGGKPVLDWVAAAAQAIPGVDRVIVATSTGAEDDAVAAWAGSAGVQVFRGDENDVLGRFAGAARLGKADVVVRITADCPLLDPVEAGKVVAAMGPDVDYASNIDPRTYPDGLDCEAFTCRALEEAVVKATGPGEREHVTPYLRNPANAYRTRNIRRLGVSLAHERWTLDTAADLAFLRAVVARLADDRPPRYLSILHTLDREPDLRTLNAAGRIGGRHVESLTAEGTNGLSPPPSAER